MQCEHAEERVAVEAEWTTSTLAAHARESEVKIVTTVVCAETEAKMHAVITPVQVRESQLEPVATATVLQTTGSETKQAAERKAETTPATMAVAAAERETETNPATVAMEAGEHGAETTPTKMAGDAAEHEAEMTLATTALEVAEDETETKLATMAVEAAKHDAETSSPATAALEVAEREIETKPLTVTVGAAGNGAKTSPATIAMESTDHETSTTLATMAPEALEGEVETEPVNVGANAAETEIKTTLVTMAEEVAEREAETKPADVAGQNATTALQAADNDTEPKATTPLPPERRSEFWHQLEGVPRPVAGSDGHGNGSRSVLLAWNRHGHVLLHRFSKQLEVHYDGSGGEQAFANPDGVQIAALSDKCCCLGCGTKLLIRSSEPWEHADFEVPFGDPAEVAEAVACGSEFTAALTSRRLLRIYSSSGIPVGLIALPGRGVALAAQGSTLLVVTEVPRGSHTLELQNALAFKVFDVAARVQRAAGHVPLSRGSHLRWLGLSAELAPVTIDSVGVVRVFLGAGAGTLTGAGIGEWLPVLSLAEEEATRDLWVVHNKQGVLFCADLRGAGLAGVEADAVRNPLLELHWKLPLGPMPVAGAAIAEAFREELLSRHLDSLPGGDFSKSWKKKSLQVFGSLVQAEQVERALDLARSAATGGGERRLLTMVQQFAEKAGLHRLADEIGLLLAAPERQPMAPAGGTGNRLEPPAALIRRGGAPEMDATREERPQKASRQR